MKRLGLVLRFKPGVDRARAARILAALPHNLFEHEGHIEGDCGAGSRFVQHQSLAEDLHEYDDRDGGPVFYVP